MLKQEKKRTGVEKRMKKICICESRIDGKENKVVPACKITREREKERKKGRVECVCVRERERERERVHDMS